MVNGGLSKADDMSRCSRKPQNAYGIGGQCVVCDNASKYLAVWHKHSGTSVVAAPDTPW